MQHEAMERLRRLGVIEGVSLLALLCVAMPLKYLADIPEAVAIVGWVHGALFLGFCASLAHVVIAHRWPVSHAIRPLVASVVPFGFLVVDPWLRRLATA